MVKIVKKKADMQVRDKILTLVDSWQDAFGGPGGKHPQYYWAYSELKQSGAEFPQRSPDAAPMFTPPVIRPASLPTYLQPGYGMPVNSSLRLDEAMSSNEPSLSLSDLERMMSAVELFSEMLRAVNPNDREAVNDEIITELVNQCRSYQKKIMSLVSSVRDEELLGQALDLNDNLQILLAKHDAIASGSPLPAEETDVLSELPAGTTRTPSATVAPTIVSTNVLDDEEEEEEDEDDEFSQLARRNSKFRSANAKSSSSGLGTSLSTTHDGIASSAASVTSTASPSNPSSALSLPDPPAPVRTSPEEQVINDLLALTVSSNPSPPPHSAQTPEPALNQGGSPANDHPQPYYVNQGNAAAPYNSYAAPWAQPQSQTAGVQQQSLPQSQLPYNSSPYPPPPWASQDNTESNPFIAASSQHHSTSNSPMNVPLNLRPVQQSHSFGVPLRSSGSESPIKQTLKQPISARARRPSYVSSNKLFDDLFEKNADGSLKVGNTVGAGTSSPYKP